VIQARIRSYTTRDANPSAFHVIFNEPFGQGDVSMVVLYFWVVASHNARGSANLPRLYGLDKRIRRSAQCPDGFHGKSAYSGDRFHGNICSAAKKIPMPFLY
jgi:hypothetical protein